MFYMKEFDELISIIDTLLGPGGCPWDQEQTLQTLRSSIVEEVFEFIEAVDLDDNHLLKEELGDLFFNVVLLSKIAQKEKRFDVQDILQEINDKLVRRHPHVFGEGKKIHTVEELHRQWDQIKKEEKGKEQRKSALDGISKDQPIIARAQKVLHKIQKTGFEIPVPKISINVEREGELGQKLLALILHAKEKGLDAEHALRKVLTHLEKDFRGYEAMNK
jgi:MazG family protein